MAVVDLDASKQIQLAAVPDGLVSSVMERVRMEEEYFQFRKTMAFVFCGLCLSILGFMWSLGLFLGDIARSGFSLVVSLAVSDTGTVLSYWQDFGYSVLETLPAISAIFMLSTFIGALYFMVRTWQQAKIAVHFYRVAHR